MLYQHLRQTFKLRGFGPAGNSPASFTIATLKVLRSLSYSSITQCPALQTRAISNFHEEPVTAVCAEFHLPCLLFRVGSIQPNARRSPIRPTPSNRSLNWTTINCSLKNNTPEKPATSELIRRKTERAITGRSEPAEQK